jgi:hypothetical protein
MVSFKRSKQPAEPPGVQPPTAMGADDEPTLPRPLPVNAGELDVGNVDGSVLRVAGFKGQSLRCGH